MWPVSTSLATKLCGCKQELEKTTTLIAYPANAKKKKKKNLIAIAFTATIASHQFDYPGEPSPSQREEKRVHNKPEEP